MIALRKSYDDPAFHRMQGFCILLGIGGVFAIAFMTWQSHLLGKAVKAERISIDQLAAQDYELRERARQLGDGSVSE